MVAPRLGILGGIFDPVHHGHLAAAQLACSHFDLHPFLLIPSGTPPHKRGVTSGHHRVQMLELAVSSNRQIQIYSGEIERSGPSFTFDTLVELRGLYPCHEFYFLIGSDNLTEIVGWHRWREILERVTLCVAERPGYGCEVPPELSGARIEFFPSPHWGLSSSVLRSYLEQGTSCKYLVPDPALDYIAAQGLYTAGAA